MMRVPTVSLQLLALSCPLRHQQGRGIGVVAFSSLTNVRQQRCWSSSLSNKLHHHHRHTKCLSVAASSQDVAAATTAETSAVDVSNQSSNQQQVVLVRRNRQSMAFRNGSPLVFSGAIESTYALGNSDDAQPPAMGSLVLVSVSPKNCKERGGGGGNKFRGAKDRRRGGGGGSRRKDKDEGNKNIPHHAINLGSDDKRDGAQMVKQAQDIGFGVYNPSSMYRVRILCHLSSHNAIFRSVKSIIKDKGMEGQREALSLIVRSKLSDAVKARLLLNLPSESTDSYRLVNGEGDGLSGLAVDVLGSRVAVVMSSAAWVEIHKDLILECLDDVLKNEHPSYESKGGLEIMWRNTPSRLKQDGYASAEGDDGAEGDDDDNEKNECVVIKETDVLYQTYPFSKSQKTGFYCDQRDNRLDVAQLCAGKRVLDLCCYNGGFALNAMAHGRATSCLGVDSSQDAIDAAIANAKLNGLDDNRIQFVRDDIAQYMKQAEEDSLEYDVIVLDPPKLAPSASGLDRASRKYTALNRDAMKIMNKAEGGLLLTCTCSGAMTQKDGGNFFLQTVKNAALAAGRQVTMLRKSGAAPCHTQCPASYPAGAYLTAALFYVSPESM